MAHATFVNVLDSRDHLLVDPHCRFFVESLMFHNVVEQLTIGAVLHNQVKLCFCLYNLNGGKNLNYLVKLDDVGVPNFF